MQNLFNRVKNDRFSEISWNMEKGKLLEFLNPPYDRVTGKRIVKQGTFNQIKGIELPESVLQNVDRFEDGTLYVDLEKAVVPVKGNKIDWEKVNR